VPVGSVAFVFDRMSFALDAAERCVGLWGERARALGLAVGEDPSYGLAERVEPLELGLAGLGGGGVG
jgi:hypothetical protein